MAKTPRVSSGGECYNMVVRLVSNEYASLVERNYGKCRVVFSCTIS